MMCEQPIKLVYVDDRIDAILSRYLDEFSSQQVDLNLNYQEVPFSKEDTYEELLRNELVRTANILLIDSRLFEEADAGKEKFTGEEFRIILSRMFPYIEVVVISQNALDVSWSCVEKCKGNRNYAQAKVHYDGKLKATLEEKVKIIRETRMLIARLENRENIDRALVEKIRNLADGTDEYDELKVSDIDRLVQAFNDLVSKG